MDIFHFKKITQSDPRMIEIYRLRFKVYCLECGYENACDYLNNLESDQYDRVSVHFCAEEGHSGDIVGTARIIMPSEYGFPATTNFKVDPTLVPNVGPGRVGEVSRLAISKEYRRRKIDEAIFGENVISLMDEREKRDWRKRFENELVTGLYHSVYAESIDLGIQYLFAVMSDGLHALLTRWGLIWKPIGPAIDYHGMRRPYIGSIEENMGWFEAEKREKFSI